MFVNHLAVVKFDSLTRLIPNQFRVLDVLVDFVDDLSRYECVSPSFWNEYAKVCPPIVVAGNDIEDILRTLDYALRDLAVPGLLLDRLSVSGREEICVNEKVEVSLKFFERKIAEYAGMQCAALWPGEPTIFVYDTGDEHLTIVHPPRIYCSVFGSSWILSGYVFSPNEFRHCLVAGDQPGVYEPSARAN
ncbi:hypothetical protein ACFQL4_28430 [Halosimplex aquaticum]